MWGSLRVWPDSYLDPQHLWEACMNALLPLSFKGLLSRVCSGHGKSWEMIVNSRNVYNCLHKLFNVGKPMIHYALNH